MPSECQPSVVVVALVVVLVEIAIAEIEIGTSCVLGFFFFLVILNMDILETKGS